MNMENNYSAASKFLKELKRSTKNNTLYRNGKVMCRGQLNHTNASSWDLNFWSFTQSSSDAPIFHFFYTDKVSVPLEQPLLTVEMRWGTKFWLNSTSPPNLTLLYATYGLFYKSKHPFDTVKQNHIENQIVKKTKNNEHIHQ